MSATFPRGEVWPQKSVLVTKYYKRKELSRKIVWIRSWGFAGTFGAQILNASRCNRQLIEQGKLFTSIPILDDDVEKLMVFLVEIDTTK